MTVHDEQQELLNSIPNKIHEVVETFAGSDKPALIDYSRSMSFAELNEASRQAADHLNKIGVRPGDRLMLVTENCISAIVLLFASSRMGIWPVIVNPRQSYREVEQIRIHSGARRILFASDVSPEAANHAKAYQATAMNIPFAMDVTGSELFDSVSPEKVLPDGDKQVALLIYTSGTTGLPKGVMLSHRNVLFSARGSTLFEPGGHRHQMYIVLPISHIGGVTLLLISLMMGATSRLMRRFDPKTTLDDVSGGKASILCGVPATFQRLLECKDANPDDTVSKGVLERMMVVGAPLDLNLKDRIEALYGVSLLNGYGISECAPAIATVRPEAPKHDLTVGPFAMGVEGRIVGPQGTAAEGEVGELYVRGPNVMLGYYNDAKLTKQAIDDDGWFATGDLAQIRDGYLYIAGRSKEMIIRSGFNVYPAEVEAVINTHPAVLQSAVVGRAENGNEDVIAFVQLRTESKIDVDELSDYVKPLLTSYKRPSRYVVLSSLPASSTGKILKNSLKELG